jgi:hypothetical protein
VWPRGIASAILWHFTHLAISARPGKTVFYRGKNNGMFRKKVFRVSWMVLMCFSGTIVTAQSYKIRSLDHELVPIKLSPVLRGRVLEVSCSTDTLYLTDLIGVLSVRDIHGKFLKIVYEVGTGPGLDAQFTAILAIDKGKIQVCLLIQSYGYSFTPYSNNTEQIDNEKFYKVKLISGEKDDNLIVRTQEKHTSKSNPGTNYTHNEKAMLHFDSLQHIFYTAKAKLPEVIRVSFQRKLTLKSGKLKVKGAVPVIRLDKNDLYYFINGAWYHKGYEGAYYRDYYRL